MINKLGIVLAGGNSARWLGYPKEMLPIGNGETLLNRTLTAMTIAEVDRIVLVTSNEKIDMHARWLGDTVDYKVKKAANMWGAITPAFTYDAEQYLFAMPDTYYPLTIFQGLEDADFNIGYFETDKPERFGVLAEDNKIYDKHPLPPSTYKAWGVLSWSKKVVDYWKQYEITDYTQAFNIAIDQFGYTMTKMMFYHDMATFDDYKEFINGL